MISLIPEGQDFELSMKVKGKKVVISADSKAQANCIYRQVRNLITGEGSETSHIGFTFQLNDQEEE